MTSQFESFTDKGILINSGEFDGLTSADGFNAIADKLAAMGIGERQVNYRLRDWGVFSSALLGCTNPQC